MNSNSSQNASLHDNIKQPISYFFSYSDAKTGVNDNSSNSQASYTTKTIECNKHFNIYKGNMDDVMVYYCPSSKYDYMMHNQTSSYPKEYSTKISTIIMDELNVHPISLKDISWTQDNNNHYNYVIQLKQNQQVVSLPVSASLNSKNNNTISDNKLLPMNNIWIVGDSNYLNSTQNKLDLVNKQIENIVYHQQHGRSVSPSYASPTQDDTGANVINQPQNNNGVNISHQNSTVEIECPYKLIIYGEPVRSNTINQNSNGNMVDTSIQNQTGMLLCNIARGNPYANFIHDELHLQRYGINDTGDWIKETVTKLDTHLERYNYQITLKPSHTIKTLDFLNSHGGAQIYFIGEKRNNSAQVINKAQTEQIKKLVNFHSEKVELGNVEIFTLMLPIFLLIIMVISSIIAKNKEQKLKKEQEEKNKVYAIKKIE